jgi:hypothetical protein
LSGDRGARLLALSTPLSRKKDVQLTALHRQLAATLRAAGRRDLVSHLSNPELGELLAGIPGIEPAVVKRAERLNLEVILGNWRTGGCRCAVIAFPPDSPPDFVFLSKP